MSTDTFRFDPQTRAFIRESDGEIMATLSPDLTLEWTHSSRQQHYGREITALLETLDPATLTQTPTAPPQAPPPENKPTKPSKKTASPDPAPSSAPVPKRTGPARHPQFGAYSDVHLIHDHATLTDEDFRAKWGSRMTLSAVRTARASDIIPAETAEEIETRLA